MRWWLSTGALAAAVGFALGGCTDPREDATGQTTTTSTTVQADPTSAACSHFETLWTEQAQIYAPDGMPFGGLDDPHSDAAIEASRQAFAAAAAGSTAAQRLGAKAETLYNAGDPADFNATVTRFFQEICGTDPPYVECEPDTLCTRLATACLPRRPGLTPAVS